MNETVKSQVRSTHFFQECKMSDIQIFLNSRNKAVQEAHLARARLPTATLDSLVSLNNLLFRSHQRLQTVANKNNRHNEEHLGETKTMSQARTTQKSTMA